MNNNKWKFRIVIVLLLIPLFFINVKDSHDWGDDFAQYLIQAKNIIEHRPQTENGLLQNEKDPAYAIQAYPVGFPLIISPVYFFWKYNILPYYILISILLFLTGYLSFEYFRKRTDIFTSIIITLLFCYNVSTLDLKKQILSEIPFTCLLMAVVLWPETKYYRKKYSWVVTAILLAFLASIRLAGFAIIAGYILYELIEIKNQRGGKESYSKFVRLCLTILTAFLLFILLNGILYPINPGGLFSFYSTAFQSHEIQLLNNLKFYYKVVEFLFPFYGSWIPSIWIIIALAGWLIRLIKSPSLGEYIFPFYSLIIIFYPYTNAGLRFLIPLLPFLIYYSYYFFYWMFNRLSEKVNWISTAILFLVLSRLCWSGVWNHFESIRN